MATYEDGRSRAQNVRETGSGKGQVSREQVPPPLPPGKHDAYPRRVNFDDGMRKERARDEIHREYYPAPPKSVSYHDGGYDSYNPYHFQPPPAQNNKVIHEPRRYPGPPPVVRSPSPLLPPREMPNDSYYYGPDGIHCTRYKKEYGGIYASHANARPGLVANQVQQPAVYMNPEDPKDVTIHMSLDTTPDAEGFLEHNARLRRLAHFNAAISQFDKELASSLDNIYVRVQYGHCLYDAKKYRKLAELARKYPSVEEPSDAPVDLDGDLLLNWNLLLRTAEAVSELDFHGTIEGKWLAPKALQCLNRERLDSTEIQILALAVCVSAQDQIKGAADWHSVYMDLKYDQRIWDFRDLFLALEEKLGLKQARDLLFLQDERADTPIETIITDWSELDEDESTYFGALDLFSSLAFACMKDKGNIKDAEKCLQVAEHFATYLLEQDIRNLKTRPCMMWMMAKVLFEEYSMDNDEDNNVFFRGTLRGKYRVCPRVFPHNELPLYAPFDDEIPEWRPGASGISDTAKRTTRVVLKAAEEIGDVAVQVGCLQLLLDQGSDNPPREIKRINELWMSAGNMACYLRFQLFCFMLLKTESDKRALRRGILNHGECRSPGFTEYCRCMVLRALSSRAWEKELYRTRANDTTVDNPNGSDGDGEDRHAKIGKEGVILVQRYTKGASKRRKKQEEEDRKKSEEVERQKRRELQERALRRDAEKDMQIMKLQEELEALRRTRPYPAQITWDFPGTKKGKNHKDRSEERTGDRNDADAGKEQPGAEVADADDSEDGSNIADGDGQLSKSALGGSPNVGFLTRN